MKKIAKFEKVSEEIFAQAWSDRFGSKEGAAKALERIPLPRRATSGSAGYDFALPCDLTLRPGETAKIPTGIRARIAEGWVLMIYPRSGLGFKYRLQLNNTVGVIDSDYYHSSNSPTTPTRAKFSRCAPVTALRREFSPPSALWRTTTLTASATAASAARAHGNDFYIKYRPNPTHDAANTTQDNAAAPR